MAEPRTVASWILGGLALAALVAMAPFFLASGLVAPIWASLLLILLWLTLLGTGVVLLSRRRPLWVLPLPLLAALIWFGALTLGERLLGWSA